MGVTLGEEVGYQVRFTDESSPKTRLRVVTDGILLAQIQRDPKLMQYDTIIIDEAHERSLNIDFLLGYLTALLPKRRDLKLVITSATIDSVKFRSISNTRCTRRCRSSKCRDARIRCRSCMSRWAPRRR